MTEPGQGQSNPRWKRVWFVLLGALVALSLVTIGWVVFLGARDDRTYVVGSARMSSTTFWPGADSVEPTDETCLVAFKEYSETLQRVDSLLRAPVSLPPSEPGRSRPSLRKHTSINPVYFERLTTGACPSRRSWIVAAKQFQGTDPGDLYPETLPHGLEGDDVLRRMWRLTCRGVVFEGMEDERPYSNWAAPACRNRSG